MFANGFPQRSLCALIAFVTTASLQCFAQQRTPVKLTDEAVRIHSAGMLFDGHNDLQWQMREVGSSSFDTVDIAKAQTKLHTDIARL